MAVNFYAATLRVRTDIIQVVMKKSAEEYERLTAFFEVQPPLITVEFIYTRKDMNEHWGSTSENWPCGMVDTKSIYKVYVFSPLL